MKEFNESFPVVAQDIYQYLAGKYNANSQINCILRLSGRINEVILKHAVRLSLDVEPILGCRLNEIGNSFAWERREDLDRLELCSVVKTTDSEAELQKFVVEPFNYNRDCQVKVRVIRAESDTICIKINHVCSDGGGFKQYIDLLVDFYNQIFNNKQYIVESLFHRDQNQIFDFPGINELANALKNDSEPKPTVALPCIIGDNREQKFVLGKLGPEQVGDVVTYARSNKVTVNDVLLTAYVRALSRIGDIQNETISVYLTVDLRYRLANRKAQAVCNLSGGSLITISHNLNEPFNDTLSKIAKETKKMKNYNPGMKSALSIEQLAKSGLKNADVHFQQLQTQAAESKRSNPYFSNVGVITEEKIKLGLLEVVDCYIVGPAFFAPGFIMVAGTYDNNLSLTVNFFQASIQKETIEQFIESMLNDLRLCAGK